MVVVSIPRATSPGFSGDGWLSPALQENGLTRILNSHPPTPQTSLARTDAWPRPILTTLRVTASTLC